MLDLFDDRAHLRNHLRTPRHRKTSKAKNRRQTGEKASHQDGGPGTPSANGNGAHLTPAHRAKKLFRRICPAAGGGGRAGATVLVAGFFAGAPAGFSPCLSSDVLGILR